MQGLEAEPERGGRCTVCYRLRMRRAAQYAAEHGFDLFTTTPVSYTHLDVYKRQAVHHAVAQSDQCIDAAKGQAVDQLAEEHCHGWILPFLAVVTLFCDPIKNGERLTRKLFRRSPQKSWGTALCRQGSEHFLQFGLAVHIGQDGGALNGVVVLVEGKGTGDALDGAAGNGVDDGLLVLVGTCLQASILRCLDAVDHGHGSIVTQGSKAVGVSLAVLGLVGVLKLGAGALSVAGAEVGILQLVSGGVALQAVPAVAAQEGNGEAHALGLGQDLAHILIVVGAEHHLGALAQDAGELGLKVHVALGVALLVHDGAALCLKLLGKVLGQALVVILALQEDDGGLGVAQLLVGVIGHLHALEGVGEAGTEHVLVDGVGLGIVGNSLGGSRSGDHRHIVLGTLSGHSQGGGGGHIAYQSGNALVHHLGKAGNGLGLIALLVHGNGFQLLAVDAALFVDLLQVQGCTVDHGLAVNRGITGQGAHHAHLDGATNRTYHFN